MSTLLHPSNAVFASADSRCRSRSPRWFFVAVLLGALFTTREAAAQFGFENWNLESSVGQAHLVMVARVASISKLTIVEGAKTDIALREYRFQPVRILKGIFQREQLSMTASDLGCPADDPAVACPLNEGEFRLLILVQRQGLQTYGCVAAMPGATTFEERVPLVTGADDPLVGVIETLIKVADSTSRRERAIMLVERLKTVDGVAAVPLLSSLALRADWAASDPRALAALAHLADDPRPAVRDKALDVLRDTLRGRVMPGDPAQLNTASESLRKILESDEANTGVRLAAYEALASLLTLKSDFDWPRDYLIAQSNTAATYAERAAAIRALANIKEPQAAAAVLEALGKLPLDEVSARETVYVHAAIHSDRAKAEQALLDRLKRSLAARQSLLVEVQPLGQMRSNESLPILLAAAADPNVNAAERQFIAIALGQLKDDQAVPTLVRWLRSGDGQLRERALSALEEIDSPAAAQEVRPLLRTEGHLPYKLRIARLLARHQLADGYALATEHLADASETAEASLVLAALEDPRTLQDLSAIVAAPPDRRWHAAALTGLVAIGDSNAEEQLLKILLDDRNPMTNDAAEAVGLATDSQLLVPLATLAQSRNNQIALTSLMAIRRYFSGVRTSPRGLMAVDGNPLPQPAAEVPAEIRAEIAKSAYSLALDMYVGADIRQQALAVARLLGGDGYDELLAELADQSELEGSQLLTEVQSARRQMRELDRVTQD